MALRQASGRAGCDGRFEVLRSFLSTYPRSKPDFSPLCRPALKSLFSRAVGTVAWNTVRGERFRFLGREYRKRERPGSLRDGRTAGGGRHPAGRVRPNTFPIRPPLCPWSLPSAGFPRGPASGLMPAPRRHAATSVGAPCLRAVARSFIRFSDGSRVAAPTRCWPFMFGCTSLTSVAASRSTQGRECHPSLSSARF